MCISSRSVALPLLLLAAGWSASGVTAEGTCASDDSLNRARALIAQKSYDAAILVLKELDRCPQISDVQRFDVGWQYGRARDFAMALRSFNALPENIPDRSTHLYAVALCKFELADYRGAIETLRSLSEAGITPDSANLLAVSYSKLGFYQEAYAVLAEETANHPNDLNGLLNLVTVCAEGGDYQKAVEVASRAAARFPESAEALIGLGAAQELLGKSDAAYTAFAEASRLAPKRADARFFIALIDFKRADFRKSLSTLENASKSGIEDADLHYLTAECLLKTEASNMTAALTELDRAIGLNPNSAAAHTLRGRLLLDRGEPDKAVADLEYANRADPQSRSAAYALARAYRKLGLTAQANALFRQFRSDEPDEVGKIGDRRLRHALADTGTNP